ncbi:helix-turn-helix domain-containing protein [Kitasatospora purpeofusca]|uniref:helix-turn-helix transcriptional regulator n=1 Tax=Kitasatospora purpeofusca TaxID=67352 RepID=UPI00340F3218
MAEPRSLKLSDVLSELNMSRAAFYRMRARGYGPRLIKLPNGHLRCHRADLDEWLAGLEQTAA